MAGMCVLPILCRAQDPKSSTLPARYYVGAHLNRTTYEVFYPSTPGVTGTAPWEVIIGRQITTRWAVQLGYAYSHSRYYENPEYTLTTVSGQHIYGWRSSDVWTHALPLTVRYSVLSQPRARLRVDIIAGSAWVNARAGDAAEEFIDGQSQGRLTDGDHTTQLYLTAGLGARYLFGRHLEGVFDYTWIRNLKYAPEYIHLETTGNAWGITRSISLGVRYRFNIGKHKPKE